MMDKLDAHIRWMIRRDLEEVEQIENECFESPWFEEEFIRCLRERNCVGMVAEIPKADQVIGFMIYELHKTRLHILNFAVGPKWQGRGVGRQMVEKLIGKLSQQRRARLTAEIRETNVDAQCFFRAMGFRCTNVMAEFYDDSDEDAYLFEYRLRTPAPAIPMQPPRAK